MNLRNATALALLGWYLAAPASSLAAGAKSKVATYTNQTYGFSFQYPSDWILKEGDKVKLDWGYVGLVENSLPHGATIVFVEAPFEPPDRPESKFLSAIEFLQVRVDRNLAPGACNQSSFAGLDKPGMPGIEPYAGKFPTGKVGAVQFTEAQMAAAMMGHQAISRYYHVFQNHTCYEFQLGLCETWTMRNSDDELEDDFSDLKDILATLAIFSHSAPN